MSLYAWMVLRASSRVRHPSSKRLDGGRGGVRATSHTAPASSTLLPAPTALNFNLRL